MSRPHLIQRLNHALAMDHTLALVAAPAGFGKTALLRAWVQQGDLPVAWLSLDIRDNDLERFLAYVIAALQTIAPEVGRGAMALLQSAESVNGTAILTMLLNDVAEQQAELVLVLDDYHLIDRPTVEEAVSFLLEHQPPNLHLAIATRHDPDLPLGRLRVRGQLAELRAADLRFSVDEAADFLNRVMGLELSAQHVATLESRTEGWVAGLQLAAISMRGSRDIDGFIQSFAGSNRFVLDFLTEEVLGRQPDNVQQFLLQTSILDRLTGPLCDAVGRARNGSPLSSQIDGRQLLDMLDHDNLFIVPLDDERRWYRYHHLFGELLRSRLRQTHGERVPLLHRRASEWFASHGFVNEAIEHALQAGMPELAAELLTQSADVLWRRGEHSRLSQWLAILPAELTHDRPRIGIFHAWYLFASGQQDLAENVLRAAERVLEELPDRGDEYLSLCGRLATVRAFMATFRGDVPDIIQHARQALALLPEDDPIWRSSAAITMGDAHSFAGDMEAAYTARLTAARACEATGDTYFILIANMKLAITMRAQGRLQATIDLCRQQSQLVNDRGLARSAAAGWCLAIWAEVLAEQNELDRALAQIGQAIDLTERGLDLAMIGWSRICQVRVLFSAGQIDEIETIIHETQMQGREADMPPWILSHLAIWQVRIWLAKGDLAAATAWAVEHGVDRIVGAEPPSQQDFLFLKEYIALSRILIAQGVLEEALELLVRLSDAAEKSGHTSSAIEIALLLALAHQATGATTRALTALTTGLELAEPCGYIRIFVDEGPQMGQLIGKALSYGISSDYVHRLLAAFPADDAPASTPPGAQAARRTAHYTMIEPLSDREVEVLQLIADGLTNRQIGERLYLTLNTVKAHTRNIYGKLDAHNRTQAAAIARDLNLLSSP